jgi:4-amino-4-deoxy-L-arabinose transferase-like glycosyltransferase
MGRGVGWAAAALGAALIAGALLVVGAQTTLWDRDEPRFATAAVEMVRSGNYLYPTFNGALRPDKPVLIYWLMSVPVRLLGTGEVVMRSMAAVGMALAALATYAAGRWLFAPRTGLLAAAVMVTTPLALVQGSAATTDAVLLAWITVALAAFAHAVSHGWRPLHGVILALAFGGGLLTKGPVGIVLPLASIGLASWLGRARTPLRARELGWIALAAGLGVGLFLAWAIPANAATAGGLARQGLGHHTLRRMIEPLEGHGGPLPLFLPYYLVVVAVGFFPWTLHLSGALATLARGRLEGGDAGSRALLLGWILPAPVLMTLVATKLPHYILPIWPGLALAVAAATHAAERGELDDRDRRWLHRGAWLAGAGGTLIGAGLLLLPQWLPAPGLRPWAATAGVIVLLMTVLAIREQRRGRVAASCLVLLGGMVCFDGVLAVGILPALDRLKVSPPVTAAIRARTGPDIPIVTRGYGEPSLMFYLAGRRLRALASDDAVIAWAREPGPGVLVVPRDVQARVEARGGPLALTELVAARGFNFGNGKWLELVALVKRGEGGCPRAEEASARGR